MEKMCVNIHELCGVRSKVRRLEGDSYTLEYTLYGGAVIVIRKYEHIYKDISIIIVVIYSICLIY